MTRIIEAVILSALLAGLVTYPGRWSPVGAILLLTLFVWLVSIFVRLCREEAQ